MAKERVLVVDDEATIRCMLSEALRGWEFVPIQTATTAASLEAFDAEKPVAVLLDIHLPDGSGFDVLTSIKQKQPSAVVIMTTPNGLVDDTIAALHQGAYNFIGKPINLEESRVARPQSIEATLARFGFSRCCCLRSVLRRDCQEKASLHLTPYSCSHLSPPSPVASFLAAYPGQEITMDTQIFSPHSLEDSRLSILQLAEWRKATSARLLDGHWRVQACTCPLAVLEM